MIKLKAITMLLPIILFIICCFSGHASTFKEGWDETNLKTATEWCTVAVLVPQVEEFKRRTNYKGEGVPPDLEKKLPGLKKEFSAMCRCLTEQYAKKWSVLQFQEVSDKEKQTFIMKTFCNKKCKPAFGAPIECRNFSQ